MQTGKEVSAVIEKEKIPSRDINFSVCVQMCKPPSASELKDGSEFVT